MILIYFGLIGKIFVKVKFVLIIVLASMMPLTTEKGVFFNLAVPLHTFMGVVFHKLIEPGT